MASCHWCRAESKKSKTSSSVGLPSYWSFFPLHTSVCEDHANPRVQEGGCCFHAANALTAGAGSMGAEDVWEVEREQCGCEPARPIWALCHTDYFARFTFEHRNNFSISRKLDLLCTLLRTSSCHRLWKKIFDRS